MTYLLGSIPLVLALALIVAVVIVDRRQEKKKTKHTGHWGGV